MGVYSDVGNNHPHHSIFDMSYSKNMAINWSGLYPVYEQEVVPGDRVSYNNALVIKTMPLAGPVMDNINAYTHYFFVPYRLVHNKDTMYDVNLADTNTFEDYINGVDQTAIFPPLTKDNLTPNYNAAVTSWVTSGKLAYVQIPADNTELKNKNTLLDYLGFPLFKNYDGDYRNCPQYQIRAINKIWNDYYRDENLQDEIRLDNINVLRRNSKKDYITSRLPWQEKGTPIAMPITSTFTGTDIVTKGFNDMQLVGGDSVGGTYNPGATAPFTYSGYRNKSSSPVTIASSERSFIPTGKVSATSFDINDFRLTYELQRWQERNARCGTRFTEFLKAHFGVAPDDGTLQRPLYLGGTKLPILVQDVTSTQFTQITESGSTDTIPAGSLAGKAGSGDSQFIFNRQFKEPGIIIGLLSIMADQIYNNTLDKMWIKTNYYDWYSPEFANLGEQGVFECEIKAQSVNAATNNWDIKGFQASWNELRARKNYNTSDFRTNLSTWSVGREMPGTSVSSQNILSPICNNIFAYTDNKANNFIVKFANIVKMSRPLPYVSEPKL